MFWFVLNLLLLLSLFVSKNIFNAVFDLVGFLAGVTGLSASSIMIALCFIGIWCCLMTMIEMENGYIFMLSLGIAFFYLWMANDHGAFAWIPALFAP